MSNGAGDVSSVGKRAGQRGGGAGVGAKCGED